MPKPQLKPMIRKGKQSAILRDRLARPDGHPRRMSDAKNAYRKMTPDQREVFIAWIIKELGHFWRDSRVIVDLIEDKTGCDVNDLSS